MSKTLHSFKDLQKNLYGVRNFFINGPSDNTFPINDYETWLNHSNYFKNKLFELYQSSSPGTPQYPLESDWAILLAATEKNIYDLGESQKKTSAPALTVDFRKTQIKDSTTQAQFDEFSKKMSLATHSLPGVNFFVHGSYGDGNALAHVSDVDAAAFVPKDILFSPNELKNLQNVTKQKIWPALLTLDPEQHHGVFYFSDQDSGAWNESMLPFVCLQKSSTLGSSFSKEFSLTPLEMSQEQRENLASAIINAFHGMFDHFYKQAHLNPGAVDVFDLKYMNQNMLLFPAILHGAAIGPIYKPDAIEWFKDLCQKNKNSVLLQSLERAENIRTQYVNIQTPKPRSSLLDSLLSKEKRYFHLRSRQRGQSSPIKLDYINSDFLSVFKEISFLPRGL